MSTQALRRSLLLFGIYVLLGVCADAIFSSFLFLHPFLVSIAVPVVNWNSLGNLKILRVLGVGLGGSIIFYISFAVLFSLQHDSLTGFYIVSAIAAALLYLLTCSITPVIKINFWLLMMALVAGFITMPIVDFIKSISKITDPLPGIFAVWTIATGFVLTVAQLKRAEINYSGKAL